ncbi:MAG: hypothetical protein C5B56_05400 [Proteobacteria bacterium]|nr:MAG: hypothetical protein C5B56_05400 [Pseudomonadota bacterium]
MKLLATGLVLAVAVASPAFAQGKSKHTTAPAESAAVESHAAAAPTRARAEHSEWDVYRPNGRYAGRDPDPLVRAMLQRDNANDGD